MTLFLLMLLTNADAEGLRDATKEVPGLVAELKYGTDDNFLKKAVYPKNARCLLLPEVIEKLKVAAKALEPQGFRLKVYDCYRPLDVQKQMWAIFPKKGYVADPYHGGSHHNRGAAVDITLITKDGQSVEMPTAFDFFGKEAHHSYRGGSEASRANRAILKKAMEDAGLEKNPMEWWHWNLPNAAGFKLRNDAFAPSEGEGTK